ncbi:aldo/keto reductase [Streptococcus caprae]|uniref:Aldo/keto reductase n=1 Tax=Streptococcus caprae TaxID=1640501 RepID=A0ABV8CXY7_9STRE
MGFGAGHIGLDHQDEKQIDYLLNEILDFGINLIDTARGYGQSEERIGKFLSHRRQDTVLSTKVGYSIPGYEDWSSGIITAGIDHALKLLKTDYLDIVHLHSCDKEILERGEVIEALLAAKQAGKIRAAAYSGENEGLQYAVDLQVFDSIECSVNIFELNSLKQQVKQAKEQGMGVIAKRPIANAPWRYDTRPVGEYVEPYWERMQQLTLPRDYPLNELALR